jgi:cell division protein FtsA
MSKLEASIIDFGSSKITVLTGGRGVNNTFNVRGMGESDYEGFSDGEWLEPELVKGAVLRAITAAETSSRTKIKHLFVGVPGEFTSVATKEGSLNFKQRKKITDQDIEDIFNAADVFKNHTKYTVINRAPIYFTLDDNRRLIDPTDMLSAKLSGQLSYILIENTFKKFVGGILNGLNISHDYVSSCLAEALYLFEPEERDRYSLLVDVGYITTNVMLIRGDGLMFLKSFSLGGGNITIDLSECLEISFSRAEQLKLKIRLSRRVDEDDVYSIGDKDGGTFSAQLVHDIVNARIESIAGMIEKCLDECEYDFPEFLPLSLTGGGLSHIRGAKDILSKHFNRGVEILSPANLVSSKPRQSSAYGVFDLALKHVKPTPTRFFDKIFNK